MAVAVCLANAPGQVADERTSVEVTYADWHLARLLCLRSARRSRYLYLKNINEGRMSEMAERNREAIPRCSFCGKTEHDVRKLVAGPQVFICDECVELSMAIIRDQGSSFYLRSPAEYRRLAQDNIRAAEAAGIPRDKALSAVSRTWLRLAAEAEAIQSS